MAEVIPAILENSFEEIEKKIKLVNGLVKWVQIDIADNTLVPNTTFLDPTPFSKLTVDIQLELHMMVKDPLRYLERFAEVGFKRFYAHVEGEYVEDYIAKCYQLGVEAGLAIDGPTAIDKIKSYLDNIDCLLVMAIQAGFSGQKYREETVDKIREIKNYIFDLPIGVDGAMDKENAKKVIDAGANRIYSNSYIFSAADIKVAIDTLKQLS